MSQTKLPSNGAAHMARVNLMLPTPHCGRTPMTGLTRSHSIRELHILKPMEQDVGVRLITGLARIVGAQRHAAHGR